MTSSTQTEFSLALPARTSEDRAYRAVTVVAILTFLATLWVF
jgi:hypothetical protein